MLYLTNTIRSVSPNSNLIIPQRLLPSINHSKPEVSHITLFYKRNTAVSNLNYLHFQRYDLYKSGNYHDI